MAVEARRRGRNAGGSRVEGRLTTRDARIKPRRFYPQQIQGEKIAYYGCGYLAM
jgi:hypothetical protein